MNRERVRLCLADGAIFEGFAFGARGTAQGEVVATMAGYGEALTDPAGKGQLVALTTPVIGNVGVVSEDAESVSGAPSVAGLILRDISPIPSNFRSNESLEAYLERHGTVAIAGLDTRALTRHLREHGPKKGVIGQGEPEALVKRAREAVTGEDHVRKVTAKEPYTWAEGSGAWASFEALPLDKHVVALDLGMKRSLLACLCDAGCRVTAVPATTSAEEILALSPDGVFLSSGPGRAEDVDYAIETVRKLLGQAPLFGVGLGHQILALALGGKTRPLARGRRGHNQPVIELSTGKVEITAQNHAHVVDETSLEGRAEITHLHLNDRTVCGLAAPTLRAFSVQYQPEAGPHDGRHLFTRFARLIDEAKEAR